MSKHELKSQLNPEPEMTNSNKNLSNPPAHNAQQPKRRNTLVETNMVAKWTQDVLITEMDKFVFARTMIIFSLMCFFLGNNLNIFLWLFVGITIYMLIVRFVRWWVQRWLLYLFEFCYFGIVGLMVYLIKYQHDKLLWCTSYVYSTGNMAIAIVVFNNQAHFGSTDHISSAWLHSMPILTVWAIRWKELLYYPAGLIDIKWNLLSGAEMVISNNQEKLWLLVLYPLMFWSVWALYYVVVFYGCMNSYIQDPRYSSGLDDFKGMAKKMKFLGDPESNTKSKYLLMHFTFFIVGIPLSWFSYHNFYFNTTYIIVLFIFLMWNANKQQAKAIDRKLKDKIEEETDTKLPKDLDAEIGSS